MFENELCFTALGPSGAGKTTLLACMHKTFEDILPGSFYPADSKTFTTLNKAYKKLENEANNSNIEFEVGVEGTSDLRQYAFTVQGSKTSIPVRFYDFPGGWLNPYDETQAENHEQVIKIVQKSMVIMVAINTPYIMEFDGRYKDYAGIEEIEHAIKMSLINNDDDKFIIFVPIKCERYTTTPAEAQKMREKIKKVFANTLKLSESPIYKDRLAMALMPIHTVGNARFSRFTIKNGEITEEVYLKNRSMKFSPKDSDQPLRYAMSFLLNEFAANNPNLNNLFSQSDFVSMCDFIRKDMKTDSKDFEILCGRELITEQAKVKAKKSQTVSTSQASTQAQQEEFDTKIYHEPSSQISTPTQKTTLPGWFEPLWAILMLLVPMFMVVKDKTIIFINGVIVPFIVPLPYMNGFDPFFDATLSIGLIIWGVIAIWIWNHRESIFLRNAIIFALVFYVMCILSFIKLEYLIPPILLAVWVYFGKTHGAGSIAGVLSGSFMILSAILFLANGENGFSVDLIDLIYAIIIILVGICYLYDAENTWKTLKEKSNV